MSSYSNPQISNSDNVLVKRYITKQKKFTIQVSLNGISEVPPLNIYGT